MMILAAVLLAAFPLLAGEEDPGMPAYVTRAFDCRHFSRIDISGIVNLTVEKSDRWKVEVTLPEEVEKYLIVKVSGGVLKIGVERMPEALSRKLRGWKMTACVALPKLTGLEMSGATRCCCEDWFDLGAEGFCLDMSGASKVTGLKVRSGFLEAGMSGATSLVLEGACRKASFELSGAASVHAMGIDADKWQLSVSGASKPRLEGVCGEVWIDASGASEVTLVGTARTLSAEASGASKLRLRSFPTDEVHLVTSGAAKCEVAPQRFLSAEATGGSGIWYLSREGLVTELNIGRGATLSVSR